MSYALGQAKWIPGQISFATTRTGKLPSLQPLIEAGLPYAPYIEHGSYTTGQPDIARYGRDPYRGIMGLGTTQRKRDLMKHSLGKLTVGDAIRRLENHPYVVINHRTRVHQGVSNMRQAMALAKQMARQAPGQPIHIHLPSGAPTFGRSTLVAVVERKGSKYQVRFNQALRGLGDTLTDWACDTQEFATTWRERVNTGLNVGTQAAVLGAGVAGLIGSILQRPFLGAAVGAAVGWGTHAIWTAPQRIA